VRGIPQVRAEAVDALRALALLPVVVVNAMTYAEMPGGNFFPSLTDAVLLDAAAVFAVAALLQGKGIALLMFLFGYSLTWSRDARLRLRRLLPLGLLHGTFVYLGDIVHQYALLGRWVWRAKRWRWPRLVRAVWVWGLIGIALLGLGMLAVLWAPSEIDGTSARLVAVPSWSDWFRLNAASFWADLPWMLLLMGPFALASIYAGLAAGRLRLLHHPRWRARWAQAARWAPWALALNLAYAGAMVWALHDAPLWAVGLTGWMVGLGPLTLMAWVPWLLLRSRWPRWLVLAGRNTLSMYVGSSLLIVAVLSGPGGAWRASPSALALGALLAWGALAAGSAWCAARGQRLPLEAWVAHRREA